MSSCFSIQLMPSRRGRWRSEPDESMQTNFTPDQLEDPAMASSEKILRTCVHCGFCTATCPTYLLLGDELDSPRGRIYLIKDMLEGGKPATAGSGEAYRSLPLVPRLHDDLSVRRALHAPRRSCARLYRGDLYAALARPAAALDPRARASLSAALPHGARRRLAREAVDGASWGHALVRAAAAGDDRTCAGAAAAARS